MWADACLPVRVHAYTRARRSFIWLASTWGSTISKDVHLFPNHSLSLFGWCNNALWCHIRATGRHTNYIRIFQGWKMNKKESFSWKTKKQTKNPDVQSSYSDVLSLTPQVSFTASQHRSRQQQQLEKYFFWIPTHFPIFSLQLWFEPETLPV